MSDYTLRMRLAKMPLYRRQKEFFYSHNISFTTKSHFIKLIIQHTDVDFNTHHKT